MKRRKTNHHLTPKCHYKGGYRPAMNSPENLLALYNERHIAWHTLFKEASLEQVIDLLERVRRIKRRVA